MATVRHRVSATRDSGGRASTCAVAPSVNSLPLDTILHGDCLELLRALPDASVDAVVTDPPSGIAFMGKSWDTDKGGRDQWIAWLAEVMTEALRVLKPGGHALVWALPRTSHWTATACEDAGFEIRDRVSHIFGCLSDDSEILTEHGWEHYHKRSVKRPIMALPSLWEGVSA